MFNIYWKFYQEFERVIMGAEDFATFMNKMYKSFDVFIQSAIYDAFAKYANDLTGMFKKTGSLTAQGVRDLVTLIETATGRQVTIMGTRAAIANMLALQNTTYIPETAKEEHYEKGYLGMWEGVQIQMIPQVFERNKVGTYALDNTQLYFVPQNEQKFIKLVNEGDMRVFEIQDAAVNQDMTYSGELQAKLGCGIVTSDVLGVWDIDA